MLFFEGKSSFQLIFPIFQWLKLKLFISCYFSRFFIFRDDGIYQIKFSQMTKLQKFSRDDLTFLFTSSTILFLLKYL